MAHRTLLPRENFRFLKKLLVISAPHFLIIPVSISPADIRSNIELALDQKQTISVVAYSLSQDVSDYIDTAVEVILRFAGRSELIDAAAAAAKAMMQAAFKANLKQVIMRENNLDPVLANDMVRVNEIFGMSLKQGNFRNLREKFINYDLPVTVSFLPRLPESLRIKVKNKFILAPMEHRKLREKLSRCVSFIDFFLFHEDGWADAAIQSDETDIARKAGQMLDDLDMDRHLYTVFCNYDSGETAARLEIPLIAGYIPKRTVFEIESSESGLKKEEFRQIFLERKK